MTQHIAMLIEASGIQEYIFGSNELIQNIGASEVVTQATTDWLFDETNGLLPRPHNVQRVKQRGAPSRWHLDDRGLADGLEAEVVYAGGGNALLLFGAEETARKLAYDLTRKALQDAPGLRLELAWQPYRVGELAATVNSLRDRIAEQKRAPQRSAPLLGLGVTAACSFTGAPAVGRDREGRYISAQVRAKQQAGASDGPGNSRLLEYLGDFSDINFGFVYDFNRLGERDEFSYMAVVHADGNRMGARIQQYVDQFAGDDRAYVRAQREFSVKVQDAAHAALVSTVGVLVDPNNLVHDPDERGRWTHKIGKLDQKKGVIPVWLDGQVERLPFRPIVFGGDDVTFVCEGRLGLPLAAHYLSRLAEERLPDGDPLYARAGVAIVKTHYPFARTYELAESLCDSAKEFIKETDGDKRRVSALDWHFGVTGLVRPLKQLREREYRTRDGWLHMRPVLLTPVNTSEWRSWEVFSDLLGAFATHRDWRGRRNKVKALREALRNGPEATELFLRNLADAVELPDSSGLVSVPQARLRGWHGERCIYFDAVEALDFYVPLEGV
ncbi:MAG: Cas10/Cmr2 second palm domain-containing protein [Anaerolineae bacterium]